MLISRESLMTSSVWELAALMQHREWEGGSERENGRLRATDRKGAITASLLKKDHGHGFAFVSSNVL